MNTSFRRKLVVVVAVVVLSAIFLLFKQLPALAAGGLLYPTRHHVHRPLPENCEDARFTGAGVVLKGWRCHARGIRRGTIVYLHGIADNRASATGMIQRFVTRGFDVMAYDSRAHGESGGEICTYGYFEKQDLHRVLDTVPTGGIVLIGTSLGGAVALQEAADDRRVTAVVAAEAFSDLRTIARQRALFFLTDATIRKAFALAEERGHFRIDAVNVVEAASRIVIPVLLIHGALDRDTPPDHSQRIFAALHGPKRLVLVPGAHHNESLSAAVWQDIERWIDVAAIP